MEKTVVIRRMQEKDAEAVGRLWYRLSKHHEVFHTYYEVREDGERQLIAHVYDLLRRECIGFVAEDVIGGNTLTATAMDTGTIHQNDTDSQGGANQGVNTSVAPTPPVIPPTVPPVTPPHSTSSGGGGCAYGFNFELSRCNYTPVIPVPESTPVAMPAVIVSATPFPGAGFGPQGRSFPWYIFLLSGA
jgi:hypothetical protein